ncbi:alpha-tocopherol transfer protein-like protein [Dinothrombium tinctorium]|uniref:Alpha-tocopherol transfer protein-like protein n=1 Tax=Dinothrombium tinctorium TaxID=1965070 RepID=A0A3S3PKS2_9ACAR|nr:alpha-tocopherol transfer protein-like protein [Dinothrombium tinctorium]RWS17285.1 alpha-tocopherol transfer protein-like protein [Dinothrombium tinctorium]RWS17309.1 alpha-tocopherol transfer protein-like protein [Dinothrombium tinctorium]
MEDFESNRHAFIGKMKQEIKKSDHLGKYIFEDSLILKFLRARKFEVSDSLELLDKYVTAIQKHSNLFSSVEKVRKLYENDFINVLPMRNVSSEAVCITKLGKWDPNQCDFTTAVAATVNNYERATMSESTQINGVITILDMKGIGWAHLSRISLREAKLLSEITEQTLPVMFKKIFVVTESYVTKVAFSLFRPFLSKNFKQRITFIGNDFAQLHQIVSPDILPPDYGGTALATHSMSWFEKIKKVDAEMVKSWDKFRNRVE